MPKPIRPLPLLLASFAALAASAIADTVTLTSGERVEGKVTGETATELTLDVQVAAGIIDQRVIKKSDIAKVDKIAPDETAYRAIMNVQPGQNSLTAAQYTAVLSALNDFSAKYPDSVHVSDVKKTIAAFEAEKKRVDNGEIKFDGGWLTKAEAAKQRVQIGGAQAFAAMKSQHAAGDFVGAMNSFTVIEKTYPGSKVMPDAIELARQILASRATFIERAIEAQKISRAEREKGIATASDRVELQAAFQREQAQADAAVAAAEKAGQWPPFIPMSERSLKALAAKIPGESSRIAKLPVAQMRESLQLATTAQTQFGAKEFDAATSTLKDATRLWPANELATRVQTQIADAKSPPKPGANATPDPALVTGSPAAVKPGTGTPRPGSGTGVKPSGTGATGTAAAGTPHPSSQAATGDPAASDEASATHEEEKKPFFMTLAGAITIVIALAVILGAVNVFNKIKSRANRTLE
jgi:hypothetical protein